RARGGLRLLATVVAGAGGLIAIIALGHEVVGATTVFGIYQPLTAEHMPLVSPFINPNHLAGLMVLSVPVALALAAASPGRLRALWIGLVALGSVVCLLSASRGGVVALAAGVLACAVLLALGRRRSRHRDKRAPASTRVAILVTIASALVLGLGLTGKAAWDQLAATDEAEILAQEGKLAMWKEAAAMIGDYPWVGTGRGGFEAAFSARLSRGDKVYSHVENEPLQAIIDWGIPGALILLVLLWITMRDAAGRWRGDPLDVGLVCGLGALFAHNLVDFSFAMPGVAMPALVAAAALCRGSLTAVPRIEARRAKRARMALCAAGGIVLILAASPWSRSARAENADLAARGYADPDAALAAAEDILARHPADHVAAGHVAEALFALRDPRAVAVINRALALNPGHPGLHLVAARMLFASQDPDQALIQYRLAIGHGDRQAARAIIGEVLARFPDPEAAARAFPTDEWWVATVRGILVSAHRTATAIAYLRRATTDDPAQAEAWVLLSRLALRDGDTASAIAAGRQAVAIQDEGDGRAALALTAAYLAAKNPTAAVAVATDALDGPATGRPRIRLMLALADAQAQAGLLRTAHDTLLSARALCGTDRQMAALTERRLTRIKAALHAAKIRSTGEIP
ncbi:MAG TPA: O-antigen ligase family protein, partial [Kofleriaceae bacterium]|nr:O-antigen ligase family protein [Kofleriaceae bacterium]